MQLTLQQPELEEAVRQFVQNSGMSGGIGPVSFTAGRGENGLTAELELLPAEQTAEAVAVDPVPVQASPKKPKPAKVQAAPEPAAPPPVLVEGEEEEDLFGNA